MSPTTYALREIITIGRDPRCEIHLDHPSVSRRHCRVLRSPSGLILIDDNSRNGTFVEGVRVEPGRPYPLKEGDSFLIGLNRIVAYKDSLLVYPDRTATLDAVNLRQKVTLRGGEERTLLQGISLRILAGEVVSIVGASGAGKSTLLRALMGYWPASEGRVYINGADLYENLGAFETAIGYVPQDDTIHRELTVDAALRYSAALRLPSDTVPEEVEDRISGALRDLRLTERRYNRISTLSGGERKRACVAVERMLRPALLFLDEPTTGLSPDYEMEFVRQMRDLAKEDHTVIMVTHSEACFRGADKVAVLVRGGHLAFYGPPNEALAYFDVPDFATMLARIAPESRDRRARKPQEWGDRYLETEQARKYAPRVPESHSDARSGREAARTLGASIAPRNVLAQTGILFQRYIDTLCSSAGNIIALFAPVPVVAFLPAIVFPPDVFTREIAARAAASASILRAPMFLFFLIFAAALFGLLYSVREVSKEWAIFRRERIAGVSPAAFLLSKALALFLLGAWQCLVLLAILSFLRPMQPPEGSLFGVWSILTLVYACAVSIGLLVSSAVRTQEQALGGMLVAVLPLMIFSGVFSSINIMGKKGVLLLGLHRLMPTYWGYGTLIGKYDLPHRFGELGLSSTLAGYWLEPGDAYPRLIAFLIAALLLGIVAISNREARERRDPER